MGKEGVKEKKEVNDIMATQNHKYLMQIYSSKADMLWGQMRVDTIFWHHHKASFTQPVQGRNVAPLFLFTILYKTYRLDVCGGTSRIGSKSSFLHI